MSVGNQSRIEINQQIHKELQQRGLVERQDYRVKVLVARQELTGARADGSQTTYDPRRQVGVTVYREQERLFAVGDRIQFTAPDREHQIANRELGTIRDIRREGFINVTLDSGREVELRVRSETHLDHGYAVTSYSSQGQTAERVLVHVDSELSAKDLLNHRMAYVALSRGRSEAQIFTNDESALVNVLSRDVSQANAYVPQQALPGVSHKVAPSPSRGLEQGRGLGLAI